MTLQELEEEAGTRWMLIFGLADNKVERKLFVEIKKTLLLKDEQHSNKLPELCSRQLFPLGCVFIRS